MWVAFLVGGVLFAGTSLSYAKLASMLPEVGGSRVLRAGSVGRRVRFVTGWMDVAENGIAAPAVALGFAVVSQR